MRLHHAGDQEDLVVGGEAEEDGDNEHQHRTHHGSGGEVEGVGAHPVNKDERENTQRGGHRQQRHEDGLDG